MECGQSGSCSVVTARLSEVTVLGFRAHKSQEFVHFIQSDEMYKYKQPDSVNVDESHSR